MKCAIQKGPMGREFSGEIEASLLNALGEGEADFSEVEASGLRPPDFSTDTHSIIFEAMRRLHSDGKPIEPLTLSSELASTPKPDGGAWSVYIMNVLGPAMPVGDVDYCVQEIKKASRLRRISEAGYELYQAAESGDAEKTHLWSERIAELHSSDTGGAPELNLEAEYPAPLHEAAFHGLTGEIVKLIEPNSEADPTALLSSLLTGFGNIIGSGPRFMVGREKHCLKLFVALVGDSAKGRKGTSWSPIRSMLKAVDPIWAERRIKSGLTSGEGAVYHVRDEVKKGGVLIDEGEKDNRLLVMEGEFAQPLKVMRREGNTLSPILRGLWDSGRVQTLAKNNPVVSTDSHVSIIGHITKKELVRSLTEVETGNGFANRFLWFCVNRSKVLPFGGDFDPEVFEPLENRLREVVEFARQAGQLTWAAATRPLWESVYPDLSDGKPGLIGAITARAEAQVTRLACVYALFDKSKEIEPEHLRAALAVWRYCEASVRYIFQNSTSDPLANRILGGLEKRPQGMTRTEIYRFLKSNYPASRIQEALDELRGAGVVRAETIKTEGRSVERWLFVKRST